MIEAVLGSRAQAVVGIGCLLVGFALCAWFLVEPPSVRAVFWVSMFYGQVAAYAIVANALTIRKTEHVQAQVAEINTENVEVEAGG